VGHFLSDKAIKELKHAEEAAFRSPVPTQIVSNGEFDPLPQNDKQKRVENQIVDLADSMGKKLGLTRREYLQSTCGMAAAFLAMNSIYGPVFDVTPAEAADPELLSARAEGFKHQFIVDAQTHFVRDDFQKQELLGLATFAADHWNPALDKDKIDLGMYKFENYLKEIFVDSDTDVALLSGAPFDDPEWVLIYNDEMVRARNIVNQTAGSTRMLAHSVIEPTKEGWMGEVDKAIEIYHPDSWKGYTIGDPFGTSAFPWRLDDEELMYPFYEKTLKAGIRNVCIHKGLMPYDYKSQMPDTWRYATVWDVPKAAKDWPDLNFIIYHSACQPFLELPDRQLAEFEDTGYIRWASDLANIPSEHGVTNVYAELGTVFANCCVTHPRLAAGLVATLVKGMGADHVLWGSEAPLYGSPQWQIEAMRRLEVPEDLQEKYALPALGGATSATKNMIFGHNSARLYQLDVTTKRADVPADRFAEMKAAFGSPDGFRSNRSNAAYGYVKA